MTSLSIGHAVGLSTVQDEGRPGLMHQAVPPGGALVGELFSRANAAVDNAEGEAAIETFGSITVVARGRLELASDDGVRRALDDGASFTVACQGARVAYLAVRGGLDVPRVLGGRGTLLAASLGGHEGRALRKGDVLSVGCAPAQRTARSADPRFAVRAVVPAPIRVVPGPDLDDLPAGVLERLLGSPLSIAAASDRVGIRLAGFSMSAAAGEGDKIRPSRPMVRGAIQLPPGGVPIVLGPDHPTTGGYPVVATVVRTDQGYLSALPIGAMLRLMADGSAPARP